MSRGSVVDRVRIVLKYEDAELLQKVLADLWLQLRAHAGDQQGAAALAHFDRCGKAIHKAVEAWWATNSPDPQ